MAWNLNLYKKKHGVTMDTWLMITWTKSKHLSWWCRNRANSTIVSHVPFCKAHHVLPNWWPSFNIKGTATMYTLKPVVKLTPLGAPEQHTWCTNEGDDYWSVAWNYLIWLLCVECSVIVHQWMSPSNSSHDANCQRVYKTFHCEPISIEIWFVECRTTHQSD